MKKYPALLLAVFMVLLSSCPNPSGGGNNNDDDNKEPSPDGKTRVCFVNNNDFSVSVYSDSSRLVKFTDVKAGGESEAVETAPSAGAVFYLSYRILIDDQEFPYNHSGLAARIDAEKITRITIPLLSELDADELVKPVTGQVHIKIQNTGNIALVLRRGGYETIPQGASSPIINGGETARYEVDGGPVSNFSFMKNTVDPVAFPAGLADFVPGRLYVFRFDGNALTLLADKPLTIAQALSIVPPENISAKSLANGHISLAWDKVGTETGYVIYRSESETGTYASAGKTDVTSYIDTAVVVGNTYYYRISAVKNNIESGQSITVVSALAELISLASPEGLAVTGQTENSITLSWQAVPDATGYKVYKGSGSGSVNEYVAETDSATYTVTGLAANTSYYFAVSAVHESGESLPSAAVQGETFSQYTVTFDAAGGSPATQTRAVTNGSSLGSSGMPSDPTMAAYIFDGWHTTADGGGSEFTAGTPVTGDITVYAWWTLDTSIQYTVTFDAAGGSPAIQTLTVTNGSSLGSSGMPSKPTMAAYIFDGWHTTANGGGSEFTAGTPVTSDITVYAWWNLDTSIQYTVTFDAAGGSPATQTRTVTNGSSLDSSGMPSEPTMAAYIFDGWHTTVDGGGSEFSTDTPVTGDMTVYARWKMPDTLSLADSLTWISNNAVEGGAYTVVLKNNETISPKPLSYGGKTVGITLTGGSTERIIDLSTIGSLFTVENGVTLTLGSNVTLQGRSSNWASLVRVNSGGTFVMNAGSKVSGNYTDPSSPPAGVFVSEGLFIMNGGTISGNSNGSSTNVTFPGGGVYIYNGTFIMNDGTISGNTASWGGGVCVNDGTFTMNGGTISGNAASYGGGVYTQDSGTFTMNGGTISDHTVPSYGGGVYVGGNGTFTMKNGTISGNTAFNGGGVYIQQGNSTFTKQPGSVIYGSNESDSDLRNTATSGDNYGHAVYVNSSPAKKRNTTAGPYIALQSGLSGSAGGWE
jgi:hypothetical protein